MPIVAIIDAIKSREIRRKKREELIRLIDDILEKFNKHWKEKLLAKASRTGGDSIEVLSNNWLSILHLLHTLLIHGIKFRVGLGAGEITIFRENADECDGPAFWSARKAVDYAKEKKLNGAYQLNQSIQLNEKNDVEKLLLSFALLLKMTKRQREICYKMLWENMTASKIADDYKITLSNVSISLKRSLCKLLSQVIKNNRDQILTK